MQQIHFNRRSSSRYKMLWLVCTFFLVLTAVSETVSLECYNCSNVLSLRECHSTEKCSNGQVCYKRVHVTNQRQFDFGCTDKESCNRQSIDQDDSESSDINGKQGHNCFECCSSRDRCNREICIYAKDLICEDDESVDCAKLNSMFGICGNKHKAKTICEKFCNLCNMVDGKWSSWSPWAKCDVTCGKGSLIRSRTCDNPAPTNDGLDCAGKAIEVKTCSMPLCPVHGGWSSWDNWGKCSSTCDVGMRSRTRSCSYPLPQRFGDHCFGNSIEDELCKSGSCSVDGSWADWSPWGECSVSCGVGLQSRSRSCTNPSPSYAGNQCTGQNIEVKLCYPSWCTEVWASWQPWSKCVDGCNGEGIKTRERTCLVSFLSECRENSTEIKTCDKCYTDCNDIRMHVEAPESGVHHIQLWKSRKIIPVYCDFDTDRRGWTVFQHRFNGTFDIFRNFSDYKNGFGSLDGEFWLGKVLKEFGNELSS